MKTSLNLKRKHYLVSFLLLFTVLGFTNVLVSCSSDDDDNIPVYSINDVEGSYDGTMYTKVSTSTETDAGVAIDMELKDGNIVINKFPVEGLVKGILGDNEGAETIIAALGDVSYSIPYTAEFNSDKSNILLQLAPEPLVLDITSLGIVVNVTVEASDKGTYVYDGKKLNFALQTAEITLGGTDLGIAPINLSFDMTKK